MTTTVYVATRLDYEWQELVGVAASLDGAKAICLSHELLRAAPQLPKPLVWKKEARSSMPPEGEELHLIIQAGDDYALYEYEVEP